MGHPNRSEGFTLLEVLVAFTILAASFAVLFQMIGTGAKGGVTSNQLTQLTLAAESQLALIGKEHPLRTGTATGELAHGRSWTAKISPIGGQRAGDRASYQLYEILLTVTDEKDKGKPGSGRALTLKTFRLGPPE